MIELILRNVPEIKFCKVPEAPPVIDAEIAGTFQEYLVPSGTIPLFVFTGDTTKRTSLQSSTTTTAK